MLRRPLLYSDRRASGDRYSLEIPTMSKAEQNTHIPEQELQSDGVADSIAAVLLVALAVVAMVYWVSGH